MNHIEDIYPLSPTQEGLLFHARLSPEAGVYVPQIVLSLSGDLESEQLKQAWEAAIERHGVLRTGFEWEQRDDPFQVVYRSAPTPWVELDWSRFSQHEQETMLENLLKANRTEPFNLKRPPLVRLQWVRRGESRYDLVFSYHHLILDGWSASNLLREFLLALSPVADVTSHLPSPARYADYIAWLRGQDGQAAEDYWRKRLPAEADFSGVYLPRSSATDAQEDAKEATSHEMQLSEAETTALSDWARERELTINTVLQGALGIVLSRYSDRDDVVLGSTVSGRPAALTDSSEMVGMFINTIPVPLKPLPERSLREWLGAIQEQQSEASEYDFAALSDIQAWTNNKHPLFDCLLVLESYPVPAPGQGDKARLETLRFEESTHFPLTLLASHGEQLRVSAHYRNSVVDEEVVRRFLSHTKSLLLQFVSQPNMRIGDASIVTDREEAELRAWNATTQAWREGATLADLLEANATRSGFHAVAVHAPGTPDTARSLDSTQFHAAANQLANALRSQGVGPEDRVAVYLQRCAELPIALAAVIKAGAAFVPLEPEYPTQRLSEVLSDSLPKAILLDSKQGLPKLACDALVIDLSSLDSGGFSNETPRVEVHPENAAYVIYTSGSTAKPKGVVNTHGAIANRLLWMQERFGLEPDDRVLQKTPVGFDVSVWEFFWPLVSGAGLVMAPPQVHRDSVALLELIRRERITTLHFVPSMLDAFLEADGVSHATDLKRVICSGEALSRATARKFFSLLPCVELHNLYGPTEAAIDVTFWPCQAEEEGVVPIGSPIANTAIYLLDREMRQVPVGVDGDLYIEGVGLARGYLNQSALTAECFLPNPFHRAGENGSTMYKTGDRAVRRSDGSIEFRGRSDHQVKIRGQRIELDEIGAVLSSHSEVRQAVVGLQRDSRGVDRLVAYLSLPESAAESTRSGIEATLRAYAKQRLTEAMTPSHYVVLDNLPLTENGKLNRRALPDPEFNQVTQATPPRTDTEKTIAEVWCAVLGIDSVGIEESFFELGGHSLAATRVNTRLRKRYGIDLPLRSSFEHPTLQGLARRVDALLVGVEELADAGHTEVIID